MASAMNRQEEASPVMSPEDEMVRDSSSISNMHDAMVKMQQQTYSETEECVTAMRGGFGGYDDECELQVPRADDRALLGGEVKRAPNVTRSVTSNKKESAILNVLRNPYTIVDSIDDYSKLGFPLLFALFNMFYWCCYIYWMPDEVDDVLMNIYNRTQ